MTLPDVFVTIKAYISQDSKAFSLSISPVTVLKNPFSSSIYASRTKEVFTLASANVLRLSRTLLQLAFGWLIPLQRVNHIKFYVVVGYRPFYK
jgi:hypothetical protein